MTRSNFQDGLADARPKREVVRELAALISPLSWGASFHPPPEAHWLKLVEASSHHLVTPTLAWRAAGAAGLPPDLEEFLDAILNLNRDRNAKLLQALTNIVATLNAVGLRPLLLKGSGYLATDFYRDPGLRFMGDLDMLLPEEALPTAQAALEAAGFRSEAQIIGVEHHLPMLAHPESGAGVELHRFPVHGDCLSIIDADAVFREAVEAELGEARFLLPSSTHRVLITIVHDQFGDGRREYGLPRLRSLVDLAVHQQRFGEEISWSEIEARFAHAGRRDALHDMLALAEILLGLPPPLELPARSAGAAARMDRALDRSAGTRLLRVSGKVARAAARKLVRPPAEQVAALAPRRWRERLQRFDPSW